MSSDVDYLHNFKVTFKLFLVLQFVSTFDKLLCSSIDILVQENTIKRFLAICLGVTCH